MNTHPVAARSLDDVMLYLRNLESSVGGGVANGAVMVVWLKHNRYLSPLLEVSAAITSDFWRA